MRAVLVIQSLIILGGAYYVYTLTRPPAVTPASTPSVVVPEVPPAVERADETPTATTTPDEVLVSSSSAVIITEGDNDLGMEFPIPDEGVLEVR
jgi:hypothetical protein